MLVLAFNLTSLLYFDRKFRRTATSLKTFLIMNTKESVGLVRITCRRLHNWDILQWTLPKFASLGTNNGFKSRLDMKDNRTTDLKNRTGLSIYFWENETNGGHIGGTTWGVQWRYRNENRNSDIFYWKLTNEICWLDTNWMTKFSPSLFLCHGNLQYGRRWSLQYGRRWQQ